MKKGVFLFTLFTKLSIGSKEKLLSGFRNKKSLVTRFDFNRLIILENYCVDMAYK